MSIEKRITSFAATPGERALLSTVGDGYISRGIRALINRYSQLDVLRCKSPNITIQDAFDILEKSVDDEFRK